MGLIKALYLDSSNVTEYYGNNTETLTTQSLEVDDGNNAGLIAGIVSALVLLAIVIVIIVVLYKRKTRNARKDEYPSVVIKDPDFLRSKDIDGKPTSSPKVKPRAISNPYIKEGETNPGYEETQGTSVNKVKQGIEAETIDLGSFANESTTSDDDIYEEYETPTGTKPTPQTDPSVTRTDKNSAEIPADLYYNGDEIPADEDTVSDKEGTEEEDSFYANVPDSKGNEAKKSPNCVVTKPKDDIVYEIAQVP